MLSEISHRHTTRLDPWGHARTIARSLQSIGIGFTHLFGIYSSVWDLFTGLRFIHWFEIYSSVSDLFICLVSILSPLTMHRDQCFCFQSYFFQILGNLLVFLQNTKISSEIRHGFKFQLVTLPRSGEILN